MRLESWDSKRIKDLVKLWNQELGEEFPMRTALFEQNSFNDKNVLYEGSFIAVDSEDKVVGFIVAKKWQEQLDVGMKEDIGWIQVLLVDHKYRNQGVGERLLTQTEASLKSSGVNQILLGKDPWHYFPGIPEQKTNVMKWFEKRGYEACGNEHDLICNYDNTDETVLPSFEGVKFSLLDEKDKSDFLSFLHRCFPGRWEYEAIQYFEKGGTGREFVILKRNNEILGFSRINDAHSILIAQNTYWAPLFHEQLGGIGPLGIDPNERGKGYGIAIVEAAITYLRKRAIKRIVIDWTGLVAFYEKIGYEVWKSYRSFKKDL